MLCIAGSAVDDIVSASRDAELDDARARKFADSAADDAVTLLLLMLELLILSLPLAGAEGGSVSGTTPDGTAIAKERDSKADRQATQCWQWSVARASETSQRCKPSSQKELFCKGCFTLCKCTLRKQQPIQEVETTCIR